MLIQSTEAFGVDRLKILVFGPAGSGKTSLAGTVEKILIISAEGGLLSLASKQIDVIDITTNDKGELLPKEERIERLKQVYAYLQTPEAKAKYDWIMPDSLTEIGQNLVEKLKKEYPAKKDALLLWGNYADEMRAIIKAFRDLPDYHVVFTALAVRDKDENGSYTTGVDLNGKISQSIAGFFDEVFYYQKLKDSEGKTVRRLVTGGSDSMICKDRSGKLDEFELPNLGNIAKKIKGE